LLELLTETEKTPLFDRKHMGGVSTLETTMRDAVKGNTGQSIKQKLKVGNSYRENATGMG
jgi:hypothetical protein